MRPVHCGRGVWQRMAVERLRPRPQQCDGPSSPHGTPCAPHHAINQAAKRAPRDPDLRRKLAECEKAVKRLRFEEALATPVGEGAAGFVSQSPAIASGEGAGKEALALELAAADLFICLFRVLLLSPRGRSVRRSNTPPPCSPAHPPPAPLPLRSPRSRTSATP